MTAIFLTFLVLKKQNSRIKKASFSIIFQYFQFIVSLRFLSPLCFSSILLYSLIWEENREKSIFSWKWRGGMKPELGGVGNQKKRRTLESVIFKVWILEYKWGQLLTRHHCKLQMQNGFCFVQKISDACIFVPCISREKKTFHFCLHHISFLSPS